MKQHKTERLICDLKDCPKCGQDHIDATAYRLVHRIDGFGFGVICPRTGNEVLIRLDDQEQNE